MSDEEVPVLNCTKAEVLQFVKENDVKFIRLAFCDVLGKLKNISIMPNELDKAFNRGIPFDASAIGFTGIEAADLFLVPDPATLAVLPWRPAQGRVIRLYCDICYPNGKHYEGDGRYLLQQSIKQAADLGYQCQVGTECEFYLFELDDKGRPTTKTQDQAGYFDVAPFDQGENVRREICLTLEKMGIQPESSHHEQGPGQNEIDFMFTEALTAADHFVTFRSVVKTVAASNGLFASFMPKPLSEHSGSGFHINFSLVKDGNNIFQGFGLTDTEHKELGIIAPLPEEGQAAEAFVAGILKHIREITAFLNPLTNSYARFGRCSAPGYVSWGRQNRSQLIRIPAAFDQDSRFELRSPDPACHPYIALHLIMQAGLAGIKQQLSLPEPIQKNLLADSVATELNLEPLPNDLQAAIELAQNSSFIKAVLPKVLYEKYFAYKQAEWQLYKQIPDSLEADHSLYFHHI
jgi:glutamine synthetase